MQGLVRGHHPNAATSRRGRGGKQTIAAHIRRPTKVILLVLLGFALALWLLVSRNAIGDDSSGTSHHGAGGENDADYYPAMMRSWAKKGQYLRGGWGRKHHQTAASSAVRAFMVSKDEDTMCVCVHSRAHSRAVEHIIQHGMVQPPELPKLRRRTFASVYRFGLPSKRALVVVSTADDASSPHHRVGDASQMWHDDFSTMDLHGDSSTSSSSPVLSPSDKVVVDVSYSVVPCHDGYRSKNNGTFGLCYRTRSVNGNTNEKKSAENNVDSDSGGAQGADWIWEQVQEVVGGLGGGTIEACDEHLGETVDVIDMDALFELQRTQGNAAAFGNVKPCECPTPAPTAAPKKFANKGSIWGRRPVEGDQQHPASPPHQEDEAKGSGSGNSANDGGAAATAAIEDYGGNGVPLRVTRAFANDIATLKETISSLEAQPLNSKEEERRASSVRSRAYNKTVLLCDPQGRLDDLNQCFQEEKKKNGGREHPPIGALAKFRLLWLKDVDATLACYATGDIVCDSVRRDAAWEMDLGSHLTTALRAMEHIVHDARAKLSALSIEAARAEAKTSGANFVMPPPMETHVGNGVEFIDIGSNVGAFGVYMWRLGFPVVAIDALPTNDFLQKVSRCVNTLQLEKQKKVAMQKKKAAAHGDDDGDGGKTTTTAKKTPALLPRYDIVHTALSSTDTATVNGSGGVEQCALFSEDQNIGDAQIFCGEIASKPSFGTLRRRSAVAKQTLDTLMGLGALSSSTSGAEEDEEEEERHLNPVGKSSPQLLSSDLRRHEALLHKGKKKANTNKEDEGIINPMQRVAKLGPTKGSISTFMGLGAVAIKPGTKTIDVIVPVPVADLELWEWQKMTHFYEHANITSRARGRSHAVARLMDPSGNVILPHNMPYQHEVYIYQKMTTPDLDHIMGYSTSSGDDGRVTVAALQELLKWKHYIVKMDVETHELEVMQGAKRLLSGKKRMKNKAKKMAGNEEEEDPSTLPHAASAWRPKLILSEVLQKLDFTAFFDLMIREHGYVGYSTARKAWVMDPDAARRQVRWMNATATGMDTMIFVEPAFRERLVRWAVDCYDSEVLQAEAMGYLRGVIGQLPDMRHKGSK